MERLTAKYDNGYLFALPPKNDEKALEEYVDKLSIKLGEYEDLEEQGLLLRLPCKIGDMVYRINQYAEEPIVSMRVSQIIFKESYSGYSGIRIDAINVEDFGEWCCFQTDIGKTLFLTKEEAEQALERMVKENG